jgi:hypothetical protein
MHKTTKRLNITENSCGVIILTVPPHTVHKLQALYVALYTRFETDFQRAANIFQKTSWRQNKSIRRGKTSKNCVRKINQLQT